MLFDFLWFGLGLVILVAGAEILVRGASSLGARLGLSHLVIGLTIVAYGTSAPEMAVAVSAAAGGDTDMALGNVVGSNLFNVLVILGIAALVRPQLVSRRLVKLEVPVMIGLSVLVTVLALNGSISRIQGGVLLAAALLWTGWLVLRGRTAPEPDTEDAPGAGHLRPLPALGITAVGLGLLVLGSRLMVDSAVRVATDLGVSSLVVGLTLVAAGTSLPELATSLVATRRGQLDIAVGNVVGSNVFNLTAVLGPAALLAPVPADIAVRSVDIPVMLVAAIACLPVFFTDGRVSRWEGGVFLAAYGGYASYVFLRATGSLLAPTFGLALALFAVPLVLITLGVLATLELRRDRTQPR